MSAQTQILIPKYGQPDAGYQEKYCMLWDIKADFPSLATVFPNAILINKDFQAKLLIAWKDAESKGLLGQITHFDGCVAQRNSRGSSVPSVHCWAAAIDLNAAQNQMKMIHVNDAFNHSNFTKDFVDCMINAGLFWGGYYLHRFDPMHFALVDG